MGPQSLKDGLKLLTEVLKSLDVPFLIVGSLASSIYGIYRSTVDIDLVADIRPEHVARLVAALSKDFYADADMIHAALGAGRAFNIIHFATSYKFDVFPLSRDPYYSPSLSEERGNNSLWRAKIWWRLKSQLPKTPFWQS